MKRDFRKGAQSAVRIHRPREADGRRGRLGRGGRRRRQIQRENDETQPRQTAAAGVAHARSSQPAPGTRRMSTLREQLTPGSTRRGRRPHHRAASDRRGRARLAGRVDCKESSSCSTRAQKPQAYPRDRHACRPGHAGGLQQPLHGDRRADGRDAAEHRLLGEHQGAAGLFLRGVRRRRQRWSPTRRICPCISARWTAPSKPSSARTGTHSSGRRLRASTPPTTAARTFPTSPSAHRCSTSRKKSILFWVASRGHHADVGGISPGLDVAERHHHRAGRCSVRQFQADRPWPISRKGIAWPH